MERSVDAAATDEEPDDAAIIADEELAPRSALRTILRRLGVWGGGLRPVWKGLAAFLLYQAVAFAIWVLPMVPRFGRQQLGIEPEDSRFFQWALRWIPWAVSHGMNPLHTRYVFAPPGIDLAWQTFVPGPALATWPITAVFGSLVSLNVLDALAPALAAWAAYLVCHRLTHRFWASMIGGSLFGFSVYVTSNVGLVNLSLIFPIPLLVYVTVRHVEGSLGPVAFVTGFAALLVALFSISTELFGTAVIFGAVAFLGALSFGREIRRRLFRTGTLVLLAGGIAALVLLPYVHDVVVNQPADALRLRGEIGAADLWSFFVPPARVRLGGQAFSTVLDRLTEFPRSGGLAYVGLPILAVLVGFAIAERGRRRTWALLAFVAVLMLLTLGSVLHVGGKPFGSLPESVLARTMLLRSASPVRFAVYTNLAIGVIASLWLSGVSGRWGWTRWTVALVAVVSLFPYPPAQNPVQSVPEFFSSGRVRDVLHQGEVVYAIPSQRGSEMIWQTTSDFWFDLAQGYVGPVPPAVDSGPLAHGLHRGNGSYLPTADEFSTWTRQNGVSAVVLEDEAAVRYEAMLQRAGLVPVYAGEGVSVWRPRGVTPAP
ncbi:MAG: YfhO family protein [Actinobacteria bacterium]|nr:MAG: YfhO family protein [Actinomycetota bacterium]